MLDRTRKRVGHGREREVGGSGVATPGPIWALALVNF